MSTFVTCEQWFVSKWTSTYVTWKWPVSWMCHVMCSQVIFAVKLFFTYFTRKSVSTFRHLEANWPTRHRLIEANDLCLKLAKQLLKMPHDQLTLQFTHSNHYSLSGSRKNLGQIWCKMMTLKWLTKSFLVPFFAYFQFVFDSLLNPILVYFSVLTHEQKIFQGYLCVFLCSKNQIKFDEWKRDWDMLQISNQKLLPFAHTWCKFFTLDTRVNTNS